MSRWIDIDDISLLKTVSAGGLSAKALWKRIRQEPSIDLVRCGECKYWKRKEQKCSHLNLISPAGFYCKDGTRKESEVKPKDEPQTESTGSPIGDYRDGVGIWSSDCARKKGE